MGIRFFSHISVLIIGILLLEACGKVQVGYPDAGSGQVQTNLTTPLTLSISGSTSMVQNTCNAITAIFRQGINIVAPPSSIVMVMTSSGAGTFYSSSNCAIGTEIQSSGWVMAQSINTIYYLPTATGAHTLVAQGGGLSASFPITVVSGGSTSTAINGLRLTGPNGVSSSACTGYTVEALLNNVVTVTSVDVPISFTYTTATSGNDFLFNSAAECQAGTPAVGTGTISAGSSSKIIYFKSRNPSSTATKSVTINVYGPSGSVANLAVQVAPGQTGPNLQLYGYPTIYVGQCAPFYLQLAVAGTTTPVPATSNINVSITGFPAGAIQVGTCPGGTATNTVTIMAGQSQVGFFGRVMSIGTYPLTISAPGYNSGTYQINVINQ